MRYLIISDIQGNLEAMQRFDELSNDFNRDYTLCLGDFLNKGRSYDESRVVDLFRKMPNNVGIRGNHEEYTDDSDKLEIHNQFFLNGLPHFREQEDLFLFHCSRKNPLKYLERIEDIREEAEYLLSNHPDTNFFLFGHTHKQKVYQVDPSNPNSGHTFELPGNEVSLDTSKKYIINPGSLGQGSKRSQTFSVLDTSLGIIRHYNLEGLKKIEFPSKTKKTSKEK
ncbi:hypothetical protein CMI42_05195 [Candidatus Pacearchaeota archaeon]|nr:hypothetical protein [Candidatus Pacearchaeota archaeon]|tara:strand:- start:373 stop:1044 length:672 start_codon:yes stop_codon:yes gene_type:complete